MSQQRVSAIRRSVLGLDKTGVGEFIMIRRQLNRSFEIFQAIIKTRRRDQLRIEALGGCVERRVELLQSVCDA